MQCLSRQLPDDNVPMVHFSLHKVVNQGLGIIGVTGHPGRYVEEGVVAEANGEEIGCCEDVDAVGEGALATHIFLEGG